MKSQRFLSIGILRKVLASDELVTPAGGRYEDTIAAYVDRHGITDPHQMGQTAKQGLSTVHPSGFAAILKQVARRLGVTGNVVDYVKFLQGTGIQKPASQTAHTDMDFMELGFLADVGGFSLADRVTIAGSFEILAPSHLAYFAGWAGVKRPDKLGEFAKLAGLTRPEDLGSFAYNARLRDPVPVVYFARAAGVTPATEIIALAQAAGLRTPFQLGQTVKAAGIRVEDLRGKGIIDRTLDDPLFREGHDSLP